MQPPVCGDDIPHKVVNRTVSPFIPLLIEKITELNFRSRDLSMKTLVGLFRHPAMDVKQFIEAIMDLPVKGPSPDKAPWRTVLARTESLLHMIQEYGINPKAWDWTVVFQHLIVPTLFHQNPDVRLISIAVIKELYKIVGPEVRERVLEINGLKSNLVQTIVRQLNSVDEEGRGGRHLTGAMHGLEQIPEAEEDAENVRKSQMSLGAGALNRDPSAAQLKSQASQGALKSQASQGALKTQGSQEALKPSGSQGALNPSGS